MEHLRSQPYDYGKVSGEEILEPDGIDIGGGIGQAPQAVMRAKRGSSQSPRSMSASTVDENRLASVFRLKVLERCRPAGSR